MLGAFLAKQTLLRFVDSVQRGQGSRKLWGELHRFFANDQSLFQDAVREVVAEQGWERSQAFLEELAESPLGPWLPNDLCPRVLILDLEINPHSGALREAAFGVSTALSDFRALEEASSGGEESLSSSRLRKLWADASAECEPGWIAGHNIVDFDLPELAKRGFDVPSLPVVDTLILSLLADPLSASHALRGTHRAAEDVQSTLSLFQRLDAQWRACSKDRLERYIEWTRDETGLNEYFRWVLARQGGSRSGLASGRDRPAQEPKDVLRADERGLLKWAAAGQGGGQCAAVPTMSVDELDALARESAERGITLVVPSGMARELRRHRMARSRRGHQGVWVLGDEQIDVHRLRDALGSVIRGAAAVFFERWLDSGASLWSELHPIPSSWLEEAGVGGPDWYTRILQKSPSHAVLDHAAWLMIDNPPESMVLHAEQLEGAASVSSGTWGEWHRPPDAVAEQALELLLSRSLVASSVTAGALSSDIRAEDLEDHLVSSFRQSLIEAGRPDLERLLALSAQQQLVLLSASVEQGSVRRLRLWAGPPVTKAWLSERISGPHACASFCFGPTSQRVRTHLEDLFHLPIPHAAPPDGRKLRVSEQAGAGSASGIGRSCVELGKRLLQDWMGAQGPLPSAFLGGSSDVRSIVSRSLHESGVRADHCLRFGNRTRTVERTAEGPPAHFLGDSRPLPLPVWSRRAYLHRLPFPSRADPSVAADIASLPDPNQAFERVVLPRMLGRLGTTINTLRACGVEPVLLDSRALVHTSYRSDIEQICGEIEPLPPIRSQHLDGRRFESFRSALGRGLTELGLASARDAFKESDPSPVLRRLYGANARWRGQQREITQRVLAGEDLLVVMPTGSGKSVIFQIPGLIFGELGDHLTVVISPLIALMRDQTSALRNRGVAGVSALHSELDPSQRGTVLDEIRDGWTVLLYLAPEQLLNEVVRDALFERGVRFLVVDEAHCISEWGHDFRPEYQHIPVFAEQLKKVRAEDRPQILATTATAPLAVRSEICTLLGIEAEPVNLGVRRDDLSPEIRPLPDEVSLTDRVKVIADHIDGHSDQNGVVYVTTKKEAEEVARLLQSMEPGGLNPGQIGYLHSGVSDRAQRERAFIDTSGDTRVLVSTTAFGMGIDKPDIHWVIHAFAPSSVEAYAQEMGRAARDPGIVGRALALCHPDDIERWDRMTRPMTEAEVELVLACLRGFQEEQSAMLHVDPKVVADAVGLNEESVRGAIFALAREGVLEVEARGRTAMEVELGQDCSGEHITDIDGFIIGLVREAEGSAIVDREVCREMLARGVRLDEVFRRVQVLVEGGALVQPRRILAEPRFGDIDTRTKRFRAGAGFLHRLLSELSRMVRQAHGRALRMGSGELVALAHKLGVDLGALDRGVQDLRGLRLAFARRVPNGVRMRLNSRRNVERELEQALEGRWRLLARLEDDWKIGAVAFLAEPRKDRELRAFLGGLARMGIVKWNDGRGAEFGYRIRFLDEPENDQERLRGMRFAGRRRLHRRRIGALAELLSEAREGEDVWRFLDEYFEGAWRSAGDRRALEALSEGLTLDQQRAVQASASTPVLINAAAGSGKTHVLARRILYLQVAEQLDPTRMLVLSFSRSGAQAIGQRVSTLAREHHLGFVRARTFHSYCLQLYKSLGHDPVIVRELRVPRQLEQGDDYWDTRWINEVLARHYDRVLGDCAASSPRKEHPAAKVIDYARLFDSIRCGHPDLEAVVLRPSDLDAHESEAVIRLPDSDGAVPASDLRRSFARYLGVLEEVGKVDFAGMVAETLLALRSDSAFRSRVRADLDYLLVDEFQDTSRAQEEVLRLVCGPRAGLTVVGDNDQTIYSFNGSDVRNIIEFEERNRTLMGGERTQSVALEENFRSTPRILSVAGRFVALNSMRLNKTIRPAESGLSAERLAYARRNVYVEAARVPGPEAALGYAFAKVRAWIDEGLEPQEIAVLSRINPEYRPEKALLNTLRGSLARHGIPVSAPSRSRRQQRDLLGVLKRFLEELDNQELMAIGEMDVGALGQLSKPLRAHEVLEGAQGAIERGLVDLGEWILELEDALVNSVSDATQEAGGVQLKTIHGAKGEEFRRVVLLHLGQGFFPPSSDCDFEEERRLVYVGLTRAEEEVVLTAEDGNALFRELIGCGGDDVQVVPWAQELPTGTGSEARFEEPEDDEDTIEVEQLLSELNALDQSYKTVSSTFRAEFDSFFDDDDED